MIKLQVPKGGSSASFNGITYEANKKGIIEVPDEAVTMLIAHHGFKIMPVVKIERIPVAKKVEVAVVADEPVAESAVTPEIEAPQDAAQEIEAPIAEPEGDVVSDADNISTAKEKLTLKLNK